MDGNITPDPFEIDHFFKPRKPWPNLEPALKLAILAAPQFTLTPLALFTDCIRHAADESDFSRQVFCQWTLLSHNWEPITASCGYKLQPQALLETPSKYDYIVIVGGIIHSNNETPIEIIEYLRQAKSEGVKLIGLCTGSFILAEAGLLDGKRCAVHFTLEQLMLHRYPSVLPVVGVPVVKSGGIITSPGGVAAIDTAQEIVIRHCGISRARKALHYLLSQEDQKSFKLSHIHPLEELALNCNEKNLSRAVSIMRERICEHVTIASLAKIIGTTERQLTRLFIKHLNATPSTFWREIRLNHGHWLVINTDRSVTQIADECGFSDSAHFHRTFKKFYSISPSQLRKKHHQMGLK